MLTATATVQFTAEVPLDTAKLRSSISFGEVVQQATTEALQAMQAALGDVALVTPVAVIGVNFSSTVEQTKQAPGVLKTSAIAASDIQL